MWRNVVVSATARLTHPAVWRIVVVSVRTRHSVLLTHPNATTTHTARIRPRIRRRPLFRDAAIAVANVSTRVPIRLWIMVYMVVTTKSSKESICRGHRSMMNDRSTRSKVLYSKK
jgi:hypothetical protein